VLSPSAGRQERLQKNRGDGGAHRAKGPPPLGTATETRVRAARPARRWRRAQPKPAAAGQGNTALVSVGRGRARERRRRQSRWTPRCALEGGIRRAAVKWRAIGATARLCVTPDEARRPDQAARAPAEARALHGSQHDCAGSHSDRGPTRVQSSTRSSIPLTRLVSVRSDATSRRFTTHPNASVGGSLGPNTNRAHHGRASGPRREGATVPV